MPSSPTTILLVRHGESTFGAEGRTAGASDPDLSPRGRAEAEAVGHYLAQADIDLVVSSPLIRARETARQIASHYSADVLTRDEFKELNQGGLEGVPLTELGQRYPDLMKLWRADPEHVRLPGGESLGELRDRAARALSELLANHAGRRIVIVAHSFVNGTIVCSSLGLPLTTFRRLRFDPAGVTELQFRASALVEGATLVRLNATDHLRHLASSG